MTDKLAERNGRADTRKRSKARRKLLQTLAAGAGAGAATAVVPKQWIKPIVDGIEVPVHAVGTTDSSMTCSLVYEGVTRGPGIHSISTNGIDTLTDIYTLQATRSPAASGISVHLDVVPVTAGDASNNDATVDGPAQADQNALTNGSGVAAFVDAQYNQSNDDVGADGNAGFTATFSSTGVANCVITINFFNPQAPG